MIIFIIIGILLGAVAVIFALQNTVAITVTFLFWQIHSSLAIILMVAIISGMIVNLLLSLPEIVSDYFSFKNMIKERNRLEAEVRANHETIAELNKKVEAMARDMYKL
ncbi:MAG: LapA family protein [Patescibacteria group bacterium]